MSSDSSLMERSNRAVTLHSILTVPGETEKQRHSAKRAGAVQTNHSERVGSAKIREGRNTKHERNRYQIVVSPPC